MILNTDRAGIEPKYLERACVDGCLLISAAEGKKGKRGGVREERRLNVFQLFENKQSSVLKYLQGWGWDAGEPTCGGLVPRDPGKPPE